MSKELECLERYHNLDVLKENENGLVLEDKEEYNTLKQALTRLESIDNAKPSEALKYIEDLRIENDTLIALKDTTGYDIDNQRIYVGRLKDKEKEINTIKQALIKAQEIEKELKELKVKYADTLINNEFIKYTDDNEKVLSIIKEKGFDKSIMDSNSYAIWVEDKTEQFAEAIEKHPTILNWDLFDKIIYTEEEFDLLKRWLGNA